MRTIYALILEYLLIIKLKLRSYRIKQPPEQWTYGQKGDVLLIHGWNETWSYLLEVGNFINWLGYRVHICDNIDRNRGHIYVNAQKVNDLIIEKGLDNLILVSHSKGGLVAKALIDKMPAGEKVVRSISIASPYNGSYWGYLRVGRLGDLVPGSEFILSFNEIKDNRKIVSIRSKVDNHVIPFDSPILPNATNIQLPIIGHTSVLQSEDLMNLLSDLLKKI